MKNVISEKANPPRGHYSQAVIENGFVHVSAQIGKSPKDQGTVPSVATQTHSALKSFGHILESAGTEVSKTVKVTVYLAGADGWEEMNQVFSEFFKDHKPARSVVPCNAFSGGYQVGVDGIASL